MVKGSYCQQMTFCVSLFGLQTIDKYIPIDNILSMFKLTARLKLQFQSGTPF